MMNRKNLLLFSLLFLILTGCKEVAPLETGVFKEKWSTSKIHSAVSWWYLGEDGAQYYLAEKWPTKQHLYSVSKQAVVISGIQGFKFSTGKEPVNLKSHNVKFK